MATNRNVIVPDELKQKIASLIHASAVGYAPAHLGGAITVSIEPNEKGTSDTIKMGVNIVAHPDARAWEKGSGTKKTDKSSKWKSKRQTDPHSPILITPKNKKLLAFHWDNADVDQLIGTRVRYWKAKKEGTDEVPFFPGPSYNNEPSFAGIGNLDGKLLFNWVHHPGIAAANGGKGYLRPAVEDNLGKIGDVLGKDAAENLAKHIRLRFTRPGGKHK